MLLGGLWHGAAWTFVIWGGLHGAGLAVERFARDLLGARPPRLGRRRLEPLAGPARHLPLRLLRLDLLPRLVAARGGSVIGRLFTAWGQPSPLVTTGVVLAIAVGLGGELRPGARSWRVTFDRFARLPVVAQAACLAVGLMLVDTLGPQGVAPFIYFRF